MRSSRASARPSTDTPTHLELYRRFDEIGGIVHTHSTWATVWAQAQREIPLYGTTHADLCPDPIPVTRPLTEAEIDEGYERNTATVLIEAIADRGPLRIPGALVRGHAPFTWGRHVAQGRGELGDARGGRADGLPHRHARARPRRRSTRPSATSTTSASTARTPTTASDEPSASRWSSSARTRSNDWRLTRPQNRWW